jgi:hypothetical protein
VAFGRSTLASDYYPWADPCMRNPGNYSKKITEEQAHIDISCEKRKDCATFRWLTCAQISIYCIGTTIFLDLEVIRIPDL